MKISIGSMIIIYSLDRWGIQLRSHSRTWKELIRKQKRQYSKKQKYKLFTIKMLYLRDKQQNSKVCKVSKRKRNHQIANQPDMIFKYAGGSQVLMTNNANIFYKSMKVVNSQKVQKVLILDLFIICRKCFDSLKVFITNNNIFNLIYLKCRISLIKRRKSNDKKRKSRKRKRKNRKKIHKARQFSMPTNRFKLFSLFIKILNLLLLTQIIINHQAIISTLRLLKPMHTKKIIYKFKRQARMLQQVKSRSQLSQKRSDQFRAIQSGLQEFLGDFIFHIYDDIFPATRFLFNMTERNISVSLKSNEKNHQLQIESLSIENNFFKISKMFFLKSFLLIKQILASQKLQSCML